MAVRGVLDKAPILQAEVAALTALLTVQERVVIDQSTKLEQAVQEARAAQQRWQNTFNASPVGLLLMDENTVIIAVNDVVTKLAAKNSAEMVNRQPGDALGCLHAAEHPRGCGRSSSCASCPIRAVIEGVLKTGQPAHGIEVQPVLVVGDVRVRPWLEISAEPVVIDARSHLIVSIADITWRKQAAQALRESEERFRVLFESSRDAIMTLGPPSWRFTSANPAALLLFGAKDTAEFAALGPWNLSAEVQPDGRPSAEKAREMIETAMREGVHFFEWMHKQLNGKEFPATVLLTRMDVGGQKLLQATVRDITVQKQTEEALQKAKSAADAANAAMGVLYDRAEILRQMSDILQACRDTDEASVAVSRGMGALCPKDSGALYMFKASRNILQRVAAWGAFAPVEETFSPDDCLGLKRGRLHFVGTGDADVRCRHGDSTAACCFCIPMVAHGETIGVFHMARGNSEGQADARTWWAAEERQVLNAVEIIALALTNLRLRDTLRSLSIRDPLTGLFNRRHMEESLQREVYRARRRKEPMAVIMMDIDHFKRFNDTFGHDAGDLVLRNLSAFLQKNIRGSDIACRYGGEEFVLIMPDLPLEAAFARAEFLREAAKGIQVQQGGRLLGPISLSIGLALFPTCGENPEMLTKAADTALYRAKKEGRDRICVAQSDDGQGSFSEQPTRPCIAPSPPAEIAAGIKDQIDAREEFPQGGDLVETVA